MTDFVKASLPDRRQVVGAEILVVDKDPSFQEQVTAILSAGRFHVTCTSDAAHAVELAKKNTFSVCLIDVDTPSVDQGAHLMETMSHVVPHTATIGVLSRANYSSIAACIRAGAIDIVLKEPGEIAMLGDRVDIAARASLIRREKKEILREVRSIHAEFLELLVDAERKVVDAQDKSEGRTPSDGLDTIIILLVDPKTTLADALRQEKPPAFEFVHVQTGGAALDQISSKRYHYVMVSEELEDLPSEMVLRSGAGQSPESVFFSFQGPGKGGSVNLMEQHGIRPVVTNFTKASQFISRLDEFADAIRARAQQRRYTQRFREKNYDFLRRYVELTKKIDTII